MKSFIMSMNKKYISYGIIGCLTILSLWAMNHMAVIKDKEINFGYSFHTIIITGITIWLLKRVFDNREKYINPASFIGGQLLSFTYIVGGYLHYKNDLAENMKELFLLIGAILALSIVTIPIMAEFFLRTDKISIWYRQKQNNKPMTIVRSRRNVFLFYWFIIFLCILPVFLAYYPGNFIYDAQYQMREVLNEHYKVHHPLLHTWLMGSGYKLGVSMGNVSLGFSFYTLLQILILSASFAYSLLYLYQKKVPKCMRVAAILFYGVFPLNPAFAVTATKDVLFAAFFLFFLVFLLRFFEDRDSFTWMSYVGMLLSGVLMVSFRKNALFGVILITIAYIFLQETYKMKLKIIGILILVILFSQVLDTQLIKGFQAEDTGSRREASSVPLQQLARVANYEGEALSKELYDEIVLYIKEETIPNYSAYLSDPIKNDANEYLLKTNYLNFVKLWAKVGLQYPGEYFESFLINTLGYWYLDDYSYNFIDRIALYHTRINIEGAEELVKRDFFPPIRPLYDYLLLYENIVKTPILGFLTKPVIYIWMILLYLLLCLYRKDSKGVPAILLSVAYIFTCFMGPWAALRYIYCIIVIMPLVFVLMLSRGKV